MGQVKNSTRAEKWKQLGEKERYQIEALMRAKRKPAEIAQQLGYSKRTIERELARGTVTQLTSGYEYVSRYCADAGQRIHEARAHNKGRGLKIGHDHALVKAVTYLIVQEHYAPDAALARYRKEMGNEGSICTKTLYHYIEWGLLAEIELTDLPRKRGVGKKKEAQRRIARNNTQGRSIEERLTEINDRITEGHWEGDTVVGKSGTKACLWLFSYLRENFKRELGKIVGVCHTPNRSCRQTRETS